MSRHLRTLKRDGRSTVEILRERFLSHVSRPSILGCWLWKNDENGKNFNTYGRFYLPGNRLTNAHRAAYILFVGSVGDDELVLHCCDCKRCVNPLHLRLGDHRQNTEDRQNRGRSRGRFSKELTVQRPWTEKDFIDFFFSNGDLDFLSLIDAIRNLIPTSDPT